MHSEERSRRLVIENGDMDLLQYKRRKVSANRDFPNGCGRVSSQVDLNPVGDMTNAGTAEVLLDVLPEVSRNSDVHVAIDYAPGCGPVSDQINLISAEDAARAGSTEDLQGGLLENPGNSDVSVAEDYAPDCETVFPQVNSSPSEDAACAGTTENLQDGVPEVPRNLDVHVARDFSPGCIPVSPEIDLRPAEAACAGTTDDSLGGLLDVPRILDLHGATNVAESVAEQQPMSRYQEEGGENVESLNNKSDRDLEGLKDSRLIDHGKSIEHDTPSLSKDFHETCVTIPEGKKSHSSFKNLPLDFQVSVSNDSSLEKVVDRSFPPRRRVSAVRDFPPFCGRDAPLLSVKEKAKSRPSAIEMNLDHISEFDDKSSNETVAYAKRIGESNQRGTANNDFLKNNYKKRSVDKVQADYKLQNSKGTEIKKKLSDQYVCQSIGKRKSFEGSEILSDKVIVQALVASSNCPWRQSRSLIRPESGTSEKSKGKQIVTKQVGNIKSLGRSTGIDKKFGGKFSGEKSKMRSYATHGGTDQSIIQDEDMLERDNRAHRPCDYDMSLSPSGRRKLSGNAIDSDANVPRTMVRESLRLFQVVCRSLLQEEETRSSKGGNSRKRVDLQAAKIVKDKGKYVNEGKHILGSVPGVEVGDEFRYRIELNIIGLHRQIQGGIDYVKHGGKILATSIVASGGYADDLDSSNTLVYTGQGGNVMQSGKEPEDQKLERGNLALKNSCDEKNSVRVIRGSDVSEGRSYVYDGLYLVEKWWQDLGPHGKQVFKFLLNRIPNQPRRK